MKNRIIILMVFAVIFLIAIVSSGIYYYIGASFAGGSFNNTLYNSSGQYVYLNYTDATNTSYVSGGNYTSSIIDFGATTGFVEIKWGKNGTCPQNMSYIDKFGGYCIDRYEAYNAGSSKAGSDVGKTPWASVSQINARTYCANAGKHLCTSNEWLGAANLQGKVYNLPTTLSNLPYGCNTNTQCAPCLTGSIATCVSAEGVYDMVGNVGEWTNETVNTIKPSTCNPGTEGYCYPNSTGGWQTSVGVSTARYGDDGVYFLANSNSGRAVFRGGYWSRGADAGPFAVDLYYASTDTNNYIGFRCCSGPS